MCDYSLRAVASRPAEVGETLITTNFRGTSTRGFASESDPDTAVCMLPGTELAFAENVRFDSRWIWPKTLEYRVGKFGQVDPHILHYVGHGFFGVAGAAEGVSFDDCAASEARAAFGFAFWAANVPAPAATTAARVIASQEEAVLVIIPPSSARSTSGRQAIGC